MKRMKENIREFEYIPAGTPLTRDELVNYLLALGFKSIHVQAGFVPLADWATDLSGKDIWHGEIVGLNLGHVATFADRIDGAGYAGYWEVYPHI